MKLVNLDIDSLKDELKEKGYKLTPQRKAIADIIIENNSKHLTAEEIYDKVREANPHIGLATVYRTVLLFEELGILCKLDLSDGCSRYELSTDKNHMHHHLICNECKNVIEVEDDLLEILENKIEENYSFKILDHSVKFFGICKNCLK